MAAHINCKAAAVKAGKHAGSILVKRAPWNDDGFIVVDRADRAPTPAR